jgi:hypothetical protein
MLIDGKGNPLPRMKGAIGMAGNIVITKKNHDYTYGSQLKHMAQILG